MDGVLHLLKASVLILYSDKNLRTLGGRGIRRRDVYSGTQGGTWSCTCTPRRAGSCSPPPSWSVLAARSARVSSPPPPPPTPPPHTHARPEAPHGSCHKPTQGTTPHGAVFGNGAPHVWLVATAAHMQGPSAPSPMSVESSPRVDSSPRGESAETPSRGALPHPNRKWPAHSSDPALPLDAMSSAAPTTLTPERRDSVGKLLAADDRRDACSRNLSPQAAGSLRPALTIECSPRISRCAAPHSSAWAEPDTPAASSVSLSLPHWCYPRSPRIQSLSLEIGSSPANARGVNLEDSWKGEILPDFLFLGDRCVAAPAAHPSYAQRCTLVHARGSAGGEPSDPITQCDGERHGPSNHARGDPRAQCHGGRLQLL